MTFAKNAAELLTSPEAEQTRDEDRGRWRKYLATGAGLAGLAGAGYLAHKNWGSIAKTIDSATGTGPRQGIVERATGVPGALAGAVAGPTFQGVRRLFAHGGDSIVGQVEGSRNAPANSPMGRLMADTKSQLAPAQNVAPGAPKPASTLHSALEPSMSRTPTDKTLIDIHNEGATSLGHQAVSRFANPAQDRYLLNIPAKLYDKHVTSRRQLDALQAGLRNVATNPNSPHRAGLEKLLGPEVGDPARFEQILQSARGKSSSPHGLGTRMLGYGVGGAIGGHLLDSATKGQVP